MAQAVLSDRSHVSAQDEPKNLYTFKFQVFACLWAIACLFHMANDRVFDNQLHLLVLTIACIYVLTKPSSVFRLIVLMALQLFEVFKSMPGVSNHWIFTAFVNVTILSVVIFLMYKRKTFKLDKEQLYLSFAPVVRIEVIILYFFVVFHKLNSGFFVPEVSCASDLYLSQNAYSLLPETPFFLNLSIWSTIIIESLIPILLCFRKTRLTGIIIGLIFHTIIAFNPYNGFYDFSSMIFAVYFLFTDNFFAQKLKGIYAKVADFRARLKEGLNDPFSFINLGMIVAIFVCGMMILYALTKEFEDFFRHIFWGIYSLSFIILALYVLLSSKGKTTKENVPFFKVLHPAFLLFPLIVFLNGCSPYLGLKTENSFAMFSNLRTEGGISNHYFIPAASQIFRFQDELIEVTGSSDPNLQKFADNGNLLVFYEFKHLVSLIRPERVEFIRDGKPEKFELKAAMAGDNDLLHENPFLIRKLFRFRPISKGDPQPCVH